MSALPTGTVTFLFTDVEGSTQLLRRLGRSYAQVEAEHQEIVRKALAAHGGREVDTQGDSFFIAFPRAKDAVAAAVAIQRDLAAYAWPEGGEIKVRIGLHTGEPHAGEQRYIGMGVNKAARIGAAGHGGQVLLSRTTAELVEDELPQGVTITDLGERRLKDIERPERLSQLVIDGLPSEFGQLRTLDVELRRKRRRLYGGAALIGVLAAAVAIPIFALGQGTSGGTDVPPNSVAIIDPGSNEVIDSAPVGVDPDAITFGADSVWVANTADQSVSRIDPQTRRVVHTVPVGEYPSDVTVGAGSAWVALGGLTGIRRIDLASNQADELVSAVPGPTLCNRPLTRLAVGRGALWFTCVFTPGNSEASHVDLATKTVQRVDEALVSSSPVGIELVDIVFGLGSAWFANRTGNALLQIAGDSLAKVRETQVGRSPQAVALGFGSIWVANGADDTVSRLEVGTLEQPNTLATVPVGDEPADVAAGEQAVWVVNRGDATVSRIDPETGTVVATIPFANEPTRVAVGNGLVWVTVQTAGEPK